MDAYAPPFPLISDPMDRARRHIEDNLGAPLSLNALADAAGLSPYHFSRLFTGRYGFSPMAYVRVRRRDQPRRPGLRLRVRQHPARRLGRMVDPGRGVRTGGSST